MTAATPPTQPWLELRARRTPEAVALVDSARSWTYAALARDVRGCAARLASLTGTDDRVAFVAGNSGAYALWLMAAQALGLAAVPLNVRLSAQELAAQLADCRPALVLHDAGRADLAQRAAAWASVDPAPRVLGFAEAQAQAPVAQRALAQRLLPRYEPGRVTTVMYTSGSTGTPKGVLQTFGNHGCSALLCRDNLGFSPADLWGCPTPLFHMSGLSILMRSLVCGTGVRLYERFDAHGVNTDLLSGRVSCLSAVTYQVERLLDDLDGRAETRYPASVRFVLQGGGPLPLETLERCRRARLPVVQSFGMTETASQVVALSTESAPRKPGSSGRPLGGVELRIASSSSSDDAPLPPGASGRILLKSPTLAVGYLNQPERFAAAFTEHGWFDTRDLGRLDEDGFLFVDCRLADLIVSGGENVYPAEVEAALAQHPAIAQAAVVGAEDRLWGSVPVAVCVARASAERPLPTDDEVRAFCRERLAPYKCPRRILWVPRLPMTASGKLKRHAVLDLVMQEPKPEPR